MTSFSNPAPEEPRKYKWSMDSLLRPRSMWKPYDSGQSEKKSRFRPMDNLMEEGGVEEFYTQTEAELMPGQSGPSMLDTFLQGSRNLVNRAVQGGVIDPFQGAQSLMGHEVTPYKFDIATAFMPEDDTFVRQPREAPEVDFNDITQWHTGFEQVGPQWEEVLNPEIQEEIDNGTLSMMDVAMRNDKFRTVMDAPHGEIRSATANAYLTEVAGLEERVASSGIASAAAGVGSLIGEIIGLFGPTPAGAVFRGGSAVTGTLITKMLGKQLPQVITGKAVSMASSIASTVATPGFKTWFKGFAAKASANAAGYAELSFLRDYYDPETGELRDGWERGANAMVQGAWWMAFEGLNVAANHVASQVFRGNVTAQLHGKAFEWARTLKMKPAANESAKDFQERVYRTWLVDGAPGIKGSRREDLKIMMSMAMAQTGAAAVEGLGFSLLDREFTKTMGMAIWDNDADASKDLLLKYMANTSLFLGVRGFSTFRSAYQNRLNVDPTVAPPKDFNVGPVPKGPIVPKGGQGPGTVQGAKALPGSGAKALPGKQVKWETPKIDLGLAQSNFKAGWRPKGDGETYIREGDPNHSYKMYYEGDGVGETTLTVDLSPELAKKVNISSEDGELMTLFHNDEARLALQEIEAVTLADLMRGRRKLSGAEEVDTDGRYVPRDGDPTAPVSSLVWRFGTILEKEFLSPEDWKKSSIQAPRREGVSDSQRVVADHLVRRAATLRDQVSDVHVEVLAEAAGTIAYVPLQADVAVRDAFQLLETGVFDEVLGMALESKDQGQVQEVIRSFSRVLSGTDSLQVGFDRMQRAVGIEPERDLTEPEQFEDVRPKDEAGPRAGSQEEDGDAEGQVSADKDPSPEGPQGQGDQQSPAPAEPQGQVTEQVQGREPGVLKHASKDTEPANLKDTQGTDPLESPHFTRLPKEWQKEISDITHDDPIQARAQRVRKFVELTGEEPAKTLRKSDIQRVADKHEGASVDTKTKRGDPEVQGLTDKELVSAGKESAKALATGDDKNGNKRKRAESIVREIQYRQKNPAQSMPETTPKAAPGPKAGRVQLSARTIEAVSEADMIPSDAFDNAISAGKATSRGGVILNDLPVKDAQEIMTDLMEARRSANAKTQKAIDSTIAQLKKAVGKKAGAVSKPKVEAKKGQVHSTVGEFKIVRKEAGDPMDYEGLDQEGWVIQLGENRSLGGVALGSPEDAVALAKRLKDLGPWTGREGGGAPIETLEKAIPILNAVEKSGDPMAKPVKPGPDIDALGEEGHALKMLGAFEKLYQGKSEDELEDVVRDFVRTFGGDLDLGRYKVAKTMKDVRKLPKKELDEMIFYAEGTGNPLKEGDTFADLEKRLSPLAKNFAKGEGRKIFDYLHDKMVELGLLDSDQYIKDYVPHFWQPQGKTSKQRDENLKKAINWFRQKQGLSALQARKVGTYHEGITEHGLIPRTTNYADVMSGYMNSVNAVVASEKLVQRLTEKFTMPDGSEVQFLVRQSAKPPEGYVHPLDAGLNHNALVVRYANRGKKRSDDVVRTDYYLIHPAAVEPLRKVFGEQWRPTAVGQSLRALNSALKTVQLSVSLFHTFTLVESSLASGGFTGLFKSFRSMLPKQRAALEKRIGEDAVKHGLVIGGTEDMPKDLLESMADHVFNRMVINGNPMLAKAFKVGTRAPVWIQKQLNKMLWDVMHPTMKLFYYESEVQRRANNKKLFANYLTETGDQLAAMTALKRDVARVVNNAFGSQNWWDYFRIMKSRQWRANAQLAMLAPDWTLSNQRIAADALLGATGKSAASKANRAFTLGYTARTFVAMTALLELIQAAWLSLTLSDEERKELDENGKSIHIWDNEEFGLRAYKNDAGQWVYIKPFKQAREVPETYAKPIDWFLGKSGPLAKLVYEQVFDEQAGSSFPAPWVSEPENEAELRAISAAEKFFPFSVLGFGKDTQWFFMLPQKRGMTDTGFIKKMTELMAYYATDSKVLFKKTGVEMSSDTMLEAAEKIIADGKVNNVDVSGGMKAAIRTVRSNLLSQYVETIRKMKDSGTPDQYSNELESLARGYLRLDPTTKVSSIEDSMMVKFQRMVRRADIDWQAELKDTMRDSKRQFSRIRREIGREDKSAIRELQKQMKVDEREQKKKFRASQR